MSDALESEATTPGQSIHLLIVDDQELILTGLAELVTYMPGIEVTAQSQSGQGVLQLPENTLNSIDVALIDARMPQMDGPELIARLHDKYPDIKCILLTAFDEDDNLINSLKAGAVGYLLKDISTADLADAIHRAAEGGRIIGASATAHVMRLISQSGNRDDEESDNAAFSANSGEQVVSERTAKKPDVSSTVTAHKSIPDKHTDRDTEADEDSYIATSDVSDITQASPETRGLLAELTPRNQQIALLIAQGHTNSEIADKLFLSPGTVKNHASHIFASLNVRNRTELTAMLGGTLD
ncbi:response regulator transcription factor [Bifidobacterium sp. ESL0745]|uniref:response regulator transcription factor n=1 Tax=Bifidobacterium sp. ESL0745 TaxID=2983226 RepID=UPI0023F77F0F|nr:response regulator transcription factor [Bifidobacterium sp. ESL0745]MDF7664841.1 response regulator transcription factor [Bifidobacterium sp. ESL0745]